MVKNMKNPQKNFKFLKKIFQKKFFFLKKSIFSRLYPRNSSLYGGTQSLWGYLTLINALEKQLVKVKAIQLPVKYTPIFF